MSMIIYTAARRRSGTGGVTLLRTIEIAFDATLSAAASRRPYRAAHGEA